MDPLGNPYHPSPGAPPEYLAGRETELAIIDVAFARLKAGTTDQHPMFAAEVSSGKTALLTAAMQKAQAKSWLVASLRGGAGYDVGNDIIDNVDIMLRQLGDHDPGTSKLRAALQQVRSFQITIMGNGLGGSIAPPVSHPLPLSNLFIELGNVLRQQKKAALFAVDDMDKLTGNELRLILGAMQQSNQWRAPIIFVGTGGMDLLSSFKSAADYGDKFKVNYLKPLSLEESAQALDLPNQKGSLYTPEALNYLAQYCLGNPRQLQLHGQAAWDLAPELPISLAAAQQAHQLCLNQQAFDAKMENDFKSELPVDNSPAIDDTMGMAL